ncbi:MAG: chemotaxis protein CheW [Myxococcota bacterium]|nr:chemotaxis protein CheW [Myxococcota bacterium]
MPELRNVIVFTIGAVRYALELRWVREVFSLGFVTGVPTAPAAFGGVVNLHGTILPVLDVSVLLGGPPGPPARQGDGALVIELEGVLCALRVDQVDHVASLHETGGQVNDASGRPLTLLDPTQLVRQATELVVAAGAVDPRPGLPQHALDAPETEAEPGVPHE